MLTKRRYGQETNNSGKQTGFADDPDPPRNENLDGSGQCDLNMYQIERRRRNVWISAYGHDGICMFLSFSWRSKISRNLETHQLISLGQEKFSDRS